MAENVRICTVIGRTRHRMVLAEMQEAVKRGADLIELRLDFVARALDLKRLIAEKKSELVATVRRPADGGRWPSSEETRQMLIRQVIVSGGFDWIDLETDIADQIKRFKSTKRIISYHNLKQVPEDLDDIYDRMCGQDPDIVKVAVMARSLADNKIVLNLLKRAKKPTIAFCMGDLGFPSRLLGAALGSPWVYAAFNKERGIAPGMPSYAEAAKLFRIGRVHDGSKCYAVVGDPVSHSFSPLVHNAAFNSLGMDSLYVPIWAPRGQFPACLQTFGSFVDGFSVTIPHKEVAAHDAASRDATVDETHAANTLVRGPKGFKAYNTDYQAFLDTLLTALPNKDLHKVPVLILGSGGMARAAAHALARAHATLWIAGRNHDATKRLADEVGGESLEWAGRHKEGCPIAVNCTPVGMHPNVNDSPLHTSFLRPEITIFDTVYTPESTMLVKQARDRGCKVITGVDLFVRQAGMQFHLFTGQDPPYEIMAKAMRRALSPLTTPDE
ncbi:MAG: type I 3-dehydroquinate dehydratase [Gemmataceae bacterium]|nr:type I 3-dehydroquinate dehydratase [Gemmataceae bacterium]